MGKAQIYIACPLCKYIISQVHFIRHLTGRKHGLSPMEAELIFDTSTPLENTADDVKENKNAPS